MALLPRGCLVIHSSSLLMHHPGILTIIRPTSRSTVPSLTLTTRTSLEPRRCGRCTTTTRASRASTPTSRRCRATRAAPPSAAASRGWSACPPGPHHLPPSACWGQTQAAAPPPPSPAPHPPPPSSLTPFLWGTSKPGARASGSPPSTCLPSLCLLPAFLQCPLPSSRLSSLRQRGRFGRCTCQSAQQRASGRSMGW